jgi:hypothetical protein
MPLQSTENDHALDVRGETAQHAVDRESGGRDGEQPARGENPRHQPESGIMTISAINRSVRHQIAPCEGGHPDEQVGVE